MRIIDMIGVLAKDVASQIKSKDEPKSRLRSRAGQLASLIPPAMASNAQHKALSLGKAAYRLVYESAIPMSPKFRNKLEQFGRVAGIVEDDPFTRAMKRQSVFPSSTSSKPPAASPSITPDPAATATSESQKPSVRPAARSRTKQSSNAAQASSATPNNPNNKLN